jgi:DUF1009 family protein
MPQDADNSSDSSVEATAHRTAKPIGLIAGEGRLPLLVAEGMRRQGLAVHAVGFSGIYDPALRDRCDSLRDVGLLRLGQWARSLRKHGVSEAVMVGRVRKTRMYDPLKWLRQLPDWRAMMIWYRRLRHDRRTPALLRALADELRDLGVTLIDSTTHIADQLATEGCMTSSRPAERQQRDVDFGWPMLHAALEHDFGQAIAVCEGDVVAVEAVEGTDAMIARAGELCRRRPWTLLKGARRTHDRRADVPTVGVRTIELLHEHGGRCIALSVGDVIMVDKPDVIARANQLGITIIGVLPPWRAPRGPDEN